MFREIILLFFRSTRLCVTACGIIHRRCCRPEAGNIVLSEKKKRKRKMCSKKWYLRRNISCDADLLNELLETDVPWDDANVVSTGQLRKLWDSLSELRSSLCERRLEITVLRPALLHVKTAQFSQFFRQVWRYTVKSLSLTGGVQGALHTAFRVHKIYFASEDVFRVRDRRLCARDKLHCVCEREIQRQLLNLCAQTYRRGLLSADRFNDINFRLTGVTGAV